MARDSSRRAVVWSAVLHGGLLAFLGLATLSCASWEHFFERIGLPAALNPVKCSKPIVLAGDIIEAVLVGKVAAPPAPSGKAQKPTPPPPPPPPPQKQSAPPTPSPPPVKTLPPPPKTPDTKDQEKVVAQAAAKAEEAKRLQEKRERDRQSELEAEQRKADEILRQLAEAKKQREAAERKTKMEQQRLEQLADLRKASNAKPVADVPPGPEARTGMAGTDTGLAAEYAATLTSLITDNWFRPESIPAGVVCPIRIVQIPGGKVISASVLPGCPFDESARESVENAVLRAQPLPYKGYESVFQREITLNFKVEQ